MLSQLYNSLKSLWTWLMFFGVFASIAHIVKEVTHNWKVDFYIHGIPKLLVPLTGLINMPSQY